MQAEEQARVDAHRGRRRCARRLGQAAGEIQILPVGRHRDVDAGAGQQHDVGRQPQAGLQAQRRHAGRVAGPPPDRTHLQPVGLQLGVRQRAALDGEPPADADAGREALAARREALRAGGQLVAGLVAGDQVRVQVAAAQLEADVRQHDVGREQRHVVDAVADDVDERERLAVVVLRDVDDAERKAVALPGGVDDAQAEAARGAERGVDDAQLHAGHGLRVVGRGDLQAGEVLRQVDAARHLQAFAVGAGPVGAAGHLQALHVRADGVDAAGHLQADVAAFDDVAAAHHLHAAAGAAEDVGARRHLHALEVAPGSGSRPPPSAARPDSRRSAPSRSRAGSRARGGSGRRRGRARSRARRRARRRRSGTGSP